MGNTNGGGGGMGQRTGSARGGMSDSASRNPLQRGSMDSTPAQSPKSRLQNSNGDTAAGDKGNGYSAQFALPHPPPGGPAMTSGAGDRNEGSRSARRVSVSVTGEDDHPHQTPQRLGGFRHPSTTGSLGSPNGSLSSRGSSFNSRPRLTLGEAREILLAIFLPQQGNLECFHSGFITPSDYAKMRSFWAPFLTTELRDKWYLDAVMLSVLGKDRWRSSRQQKEVIMSVSPSRDQVLQLNQQRQEYSDQLRERLLDLCGSLVERQDRNAKKTNLQALLNDYNRHKETASNTSSNGIGNVQDGVSLSRASSDALSTMPQKEQLSLTLMRLQTTVSTSFDCFDLLAGRIPTSVVSSLPSKYFLNSTPVVYDQVAYQEKKIGDIDALSFFMSIESRRRLLNGQHPDDAERMLNGSLNELGFGNGGSLNRRNSVGGGRDENGEGPIANAKQLYAAVRHAGLVVTTACSSMVLTVLFQVAEVMRERQAFRDNRAKAAQKGITLEQLIGRSEATVRTYSGKPIDDIDELKRYAITDEMSLTVLTKLLIDRFRNENRAKMEKLRKRYPNIFAYLEAVAPPEEQADFDVTRLLSGMVLKLMFLTGGGQRSIVADDRRVPTGLHQITDDVAISTMMEVPLLNRICWVACMMGMPIMSNHGQLAQKHQGKPLSFMELDECCGVMRTLFQAVGALPCGKACPQTFKDWFPLFPFYAVNAEGKRILMYLYTAHAGSIQRVPLTIQKDMTLLSFASGFQAAKRKGMVDVSNFFFEPNLTIGLQQQRDGAGEYTSMTTLTTAVSPLAATKGAHNAPTQTKIGSDRTMPLSSTAPAAKVMPASLASSSAGVSSANGSDKYQYMTAVGGATGGGGGSPTNRAGANYGKAPQHPNSNNGHTSPKAHLDGQQLSSSSSCDSLSCSTLFGEDMDVDVYTCVNPQAQLYLRCTNEATMRRHRVTELTPFVTTQFLHSSHEMEAKRPDIAPALHYAVPKLMPSEGFLIIRWTSGEPLVTFCAGDMLSAMAERTSSSGSHSAAAGAGSNGAGPSGTAGGGINGQTRTASARYFTGATRPGAGENTNGSGDAPATAAGSPKALTGFSVVNPADANGGNARSSAAAASPRTHTVTIDDSTVQESTPRNGGLSASDRQVGGNGTVKEANLCDFSFYSGYGDYSLNGVDEVASSTSGSCNAPEKTRLYQGVMHEILGVSEKVSKRMGVRWTVLEVMSSSQLAHRTRRMHNAGGNGAKPSPPQQESYRNEVVLHVAAPESPALMPLRILTIGHERASMSVFTFVSPDSDTVCWANPRLIEAIINHKGLGENRNGSMRELRDSGNQSVNSNTNTNGSTGSGASTFLQGSTDANGPNGVLCNTEEELHNVFFSIGVLLSNAITNGVYFGAPIAPLAFWLMKKALSSGDYSFKSFMWLEPADGNLLSPALVLNSAYEILTMSEQQYVVFLEHRGLADPETQIFPVMHSLADEMREERAWQTSGSATGAGGEAAEDSRRPQAPSSQATSNGGGRSARTQPSKESSIANSSMARGDHSSMVSRASSGMLEYLKLIQQHNRRNSTFQRSKAQPTPAAGSGLPHTFLMSASVPVQDRLQGYKNQAKGGGNNAQAVDPEVAKLEALYARLPSRREYLSLYLVNDLTWGSVRRDGLGEKNKELWVSMARGFMTSTLAKSPLLPNCCSRIIREVLCVPRPGS